ncbi:hypothetical protein ACFV7Q_11085 [Streptomyces sp. NPDC059851]|uniref:hypothetical protein n=1 Tax=Streptomyces sp. NPDC059851 TaxID=3346971 RepID=UPI00365C2BB3
MEENPGRYVAQMTVRLREAADVAAWDMSLTPDEASEVVDQLIVPHTDWLHHLVAARECEARTWPGHVLHVTSARPPTRRGGAAGEEPPAYRRDAASWKQIEIACSPIDLLRRRETRHAVLDALAVDGLTDLASGGPDPRHHEA